MKKFKLLAGGIVAALALTGCSVVSTPPDQVALHYNGGIATATSFLDCVNAATRQQNGPGHTYYMYPTSERTYDASNDAKAETKPFVVVSKDNAELLVPVSVTFTINTECKTLQQFHEKLGNRYRAYWGGSDFEDENTDGIPDGWVTLLNFYMGKTLDTTLDRSAQGFNWRELWNDPKAKAALEADAEADLTSALDNRMGGHFFDIKTVQLQKPDPVNADLKNAVASEQAAVAKARAAEAEANAQKISSVKQAEAKAAEAQAQIAVAKAQAVQIQEQVRVLGQDGFLKKYAIDKGITPWPAPVVAGSPAATK